MSAIVEAIVEDDLEVRKAGRAWSLLAAGREIEPIRLEIKVNEIVTSPCLQCRRTTAGRCDTRAERHDMSASGAGLRSGDPRP